MAKPKLIAVVGPTASGKTSLGIALAEHQFPGYGGGNNDASACGEIISADSRQIYRGMDIGTAKASRDKNHAEYFSKGIPHHLIDIRNPDENYAVGEFKHEAEAAIDDVITRGKLPILVGGTGLYVRAIVENLDIPKTKADPKLRAEIEAEIARDGLAAVFEKLVTLDPEAAYIVDPKNPRRIVRALEVAISTGQPFTAQRRKNEPRYDTLELGINPPPEILRERIDRRIDEMMQDGLVEEVKKLLEKHGGGEKTTDTSRPIAFDAIGYREIIDYLEGHATLDETASAMKLNTWHFAKHQITWFKKDKNIHWIENENEAVEITKKFLTSPV